MSVAPRSRLVNPLLGNYFGIFLSLIAAVVLLLVILEQLGATDRMLRLAMLTGLLALFAAIGLAAFTQLPSEYFASGRRVPAFFNGLIVAAAGLGGSGLAGLAGALFLIGFDALCIGVGIVAGIVGMVLLIMPFLRKFGAYSVAGYLGRRFDSATVRLVSAALMAVPTLLLLMAELKVAAMMGAWLTQTSEGVVLMLVVATLVVIAGSGGMRSTTWSGAAQAIAALVALFVPVVIVAVLTTNLPLPQMSHGPVLRALMRVEAAQSLPVSITPAWAFELPGADLTPIVRRFATPFSGIGPAAFVFAALTVMMGTAGSPALLSRAGTTPGVHETRKSLGWAVLILGVVVMTLSAVAVFMRDILMNQLVGVASGNLPEWFRSLMTLDLAGLDASAPAGALGSFAFKRDLVLVALPVASGFPAVLVYFAAAGIVCAAMVGASACITALGTTLAEDVINAPNSELAANGVRIMSARASIVLTSIGAGWMALVTPGDSLELFLWSLALSGSTLFPVLALSVWWKRMNAWGALAGLMVGFLVAALVIMAGELAAFGLPSVLAAVLGAPASFAAILITSILTPVPARHVLEMVRDMRIPGGETLYDREVRLALLQRRPRV